MSASITIREATADDLDVVMHHRRSMFADMGQGHAGALEAMDATSRPLFARGLADGTYRGWLAEDARGNVVAGGGIIMLAYHSSPRDPDPRRAWIVNMYTEPGYRRQGLARRLMERMIEWCRGQGMATVYLHASAEGRALYDSLGFTPTNEMRLRLGGRPAPPPPAPRADPPSRPRTPAAPRPSRRRR
jgi:GNAT superfamily N-acetyltransferase